jgi:hypothetical protein
LVSRLAQYLDDCSVDRLAKLMAFTLAALACFSEDHQPLGARGGVGAAEDDNAALSHPRYLANGLFDFVGVDVAPAPNDDILDPPREKNLAGGDVPTVTAVKPTVTEQL